MAFDNKGNIRKIDNQVRSTCAFPTWCQKHKNKIVLQYMKKTRCVFQVALSRSEIYNSPWSKTTLHEAKQTPWSKSTITATNINEESSSASTTASASSASAGVTQAKDLLSVFGKRISIFGNNSLESWKKSGWAGVGEVVEVEMDRIMGPLFLVLVLFCLVFVSFNGRW